MVGVRTWAKMFSVGAVLCVGGPALVVWVSPTEEELFKKYNPELQRKSIEGRQKREEEWESYVTKLKEYSKSDKNMWIAQKEAEEKERAEKAERTRAEKSAIAAEMQAQQRS